MTILNLWGEIFLGSYKHFLLTLNSDDPAHGNEKTFMFKLASELHFTPIYIDAWENQVVKIVVPLCM
jgi:hypothetical protein